MLANKDLYDELREVEELIKEIKPENPVDAAKLKMSVLTIKLLHNIRTNSVVIMKHLGIEMVQSKRRTSEGNETEK